MAIRPPEKVVGAIRKLLVFYYHLLPMRFGLASDLSLVDKLDVFSWYHR
jgi:hypothetical protein